MFKGIGFSPTIGILAAKSNLQAPSGLTVSIAEASLTAGATATAVVTLAQPGVPKATVTYQWTLNGIDIPGASGAAHVTVEAGVLAVRAGAVNPIGLIDPVTSAPVTVSPAATAPSPLGVDDWLLADAPSVGGDKLTLTIIAPPEDGGSAITAFEFRTAGASAQTLSGIGAGPRLITVLAGGEANVQVRAVNAIGAGAWSDTKTATPTVFVAPLPTPVLRIGSGTTLAIADLDPSATSVDIEIDGVVASVALTSLVDGPVNLAAATVLDLEQQVVAVTAGIWADTTGARRFEARISPKGAQDWTSASGDAPEFLFTGLTQQTAYDIEAWAVDANGAGAATRPTVTTLPPS